MYVIVLEINKILQYEEDLTMFCPNCGSELEEGSVFCGSCGTKINPEAATTAATAAAPGKPLCSFKIGNMDFSIVKENIDILGCAAALVAFISLFLPYLTCSVNLWGYKEKESINFFSGTTGNAVFITLAIIVFIAASVFGKKFFAQITGYVTLAFVLITAIGLGGDIAEAKNELGGFSDAIKAYPSVGFYILLLASLVMAFSWLIRSKLLVKLKK